MADERMRLYGNSFQRLCWRIKREMRHNRKPVILLFGNGYESQLMLATLLKLRKKFTIIHVAEKHVTKKVRSVLLKSQQRTLILHPYRENKGYKTFYNDGVVCLEDLNFGFSPKDYFIVSGFNLSEPSLVKSYLKGTFNGMYCPLLRYSEEWIQELYQDMKDNEEIGSFLFDNHTSDSHHNIVIN